MTLCVPTELEIAMLQDARSIIIKKEPMPQPKAGEMLVRITHAGICGSDLHYFRHGGLGSFKSKLPMYLGHEPAGVVVDPNGLTDFQHGDRVAIEPGCPCLDSKWSLVGKHNLCERGTFMGAGDTPGCFATFVCVKAIQVLKIPDNVESSLASLCEPLAVALHTYKLCGNRTLDLIDGSAVIFGAGAIGLCHLIILVSRGVRDVYMVDPLEYRRKFALELGAAGAFASISELEKKFELVVDCAGTIESFEACLQASEVNGTLALVGIPETDYLHFNAHKARTKELVIINVRRSNQCLATCLKMLSKDPTVAHKCKHLITHEMPLSNIQRAFEIAADYDDCLKILICPSSSEAQTSDKKVPIFKLDFDPRSVDEFKEKAGDILTSGRPLSNNMYTRKFEESFGQLVHAPYAIAVNSGTIALEIPLRALDVRSKVVLTPSNTFFATQVAVQNAGGTVAFVDVEPQFMQICPEALEESLATYDDGAVGAVILVHIGGLISPHYKRIHDICKSRGIPLVEDAAHAHLSCVGENFAGTLGDVGAFSFFPTKVMTAGEAGMITTKSKALYDAMLSIREFGKRIQGGSRLIQELPQGGVNGKITEMTALLGLIECRRVGPRISRRAQLVDLYAQLLNPKFYRVIRQVGGTCSYYKCIVFVLVDGVRDGLRDHAQEQGVSFTGEVYFKGVHEMPSYKNHNASLPMTEYVCANHVCPPLYPEMSEDDVERVCDVMNRYFNV